MQGLTIAFDLDGTLVDTAPDLIGATNHVMGIAGLAPVEPARIRDSISFGARAMIVQGLKVHGTELTSTEVDRLHERFLAHYADNIAVGSRPFPGLVSALDRLSEAGARLAVCTNKQERLSRRLLDALGLTARFAFVAGRDTFDVFKPHPDHLTKAIRMAGGDPARAVMVGDSETDVKTARAAGIPVVGVPFGYTDIPMHDLAPDALIEHYDELPSALTRLLARP
jgi:phosphoglycolate phosphatase